MALAGNMTSVPYIRLVTSTLRGFHCRSFSVSSACGNKYEQLDNSRRSKRRHIPLDEDSFIQQNETVQSPANSRLLKVALLGNPNSGKSTLINNLVRWKVCSTSNLPQTTVGNARGIYVEGNAQIVYLDSPGVISYEKRKKYGYQRDVMTAPEKAIEQADMIAVMHDLGFRTGKFAFGKLILRLLALYPHVPAVLVLNKIDLIKKKEQLLDVTRQLTCGVVGGKVSQESEAKNKRRQKLDPELILQRSLEEYQRTKGSQVVVDGERNAIEDGVCSKFISMEDVISGKVKLTEKQVVNFISDKKGWPNFQEVFMMSALHNKGVKELSDYFVANAKPHHHWLFNDDVVSDRHPHELILMAAREKFLEELPGNISYGLRFDIKHWQLSEAGCLEVTISVRYAEKYVLGQLLGPSKTTVKTIAQKIEKEVCNIFKTDCFVLIDYKLDPGMKSK